MGFKKRLNRLLHWSSVYLVSASLLFLSTSFAGYPSCLDCVQISLERPVIIRGPVADEIDNSFTVIKLPDGNLRGFTANGTTYAIDGSTLWDMGATRIPVLGPDAAGSYSEC